MTWTASTACGISRPRHHPNPASVVDRIIEVKQKRPTWGPKKIVAWLSAHEATVQWPSHSTAGVDHAGLVKTAQSHALGRSLAHATCPNDVWVRPEGRNGVIR